MIIKPLLVAVFSCLLIVTGSAGISQDVWKLSKEKASLMREVSTMFRKMEIKDAELDALKEKALKASVHFSQTRKKHPDLKEHFNVSDAAQTQMIKAMTAKDKEATKVARKEYVEARKELEKASREIPEMVELQQQAIDANKAVKVKEFELLGATPEGKVLVDQVKAVDAKIAELQKQLK